MAQKREKYASRRTFVVTKEAGRFGWRAGFRAQMGRPCFEDFVSFKVGDKVQAWQARNHWYYGEKVRVGVQQRPSSFQCLPLRPTCSLCLFLSLGRGARRWLAHGRAQGVVPQVYSRASSDGLAVCAG